MHHQPIKLDVDAYRDLAILTERLKSHEDFVTQSAAMRLKPVVSVMQDPIGWWKFAIQSVVLMNQPRHDKSNKRKRSP